MAQKNLKIFRIIVTLVIVLTFCAAPALQAISFSNGFIQSEKTCGCDCCGTPAEESSCPMKIQMSENSCLCSVTEQVPFNSKPIESSVPFSIGKELASPSSVLIGSFETLNESSFDIVCFYISPKTHPPFYILNVSLLI